MQFPLANRIDTLLSYYLNHKDSLPYIQEIKEKLHRLKNNH